MYRTCLPRDSEVSPRLVFLAIAAVLAGGCSTLPSSGPTGADILRASRSAEPEFPFVLVNLTTPATLPLPPGFPAVKLADVPPQPTDLLGPGDVLNITIYEPGVALFGGSSPLASPGGGAVTFESGSSAERLPPTRIDDHGYIRVPYIGRVRAAGRTAPELAALIQGGLRGMSQDPQVLVTLEQSITNSIMLAGEVARPGRLVLTTNRESLVDAIALGGGYRGDAKDAVARIERQGQVYEIRLSDLLDLPQEDLLVAPGDRITVIARRQSFSVLGAPNRAEEITFPRGRLTLAEAVALSGGANPHQGDAAAVFVFRYVLLPDGSEQPTVYHLNMMRPGAYLLSQRFMMRDRDVLYVGNARSNQVSKFVQLLSQLFVPVTTVRATVQ